MTRAHTRQRNGWAIAAAVAVSLATFTGLPATAAPQPRQVDDSASDALARKLGFQLVPKRASTKKGLRGSAQTNPRLSMLSDPAQSNLHYWDSTLKAKSKQRRA